MVCINSSEACCLTSSSVAIVELHTSIDESEKRRLIIVVLCYLFFQTWDKTALSTQVLTGLEHKEVIGE